MQTRTLQNDTVDLVCWRALGRTQGVVEATLELNPELSTHGPILPAGIPVQLPIPAPASLVPTIKLWD